MISSVQHLLHILFNVKGLIEWGGTVLVCTIVFVETGFFVGFFLPGDSLLVTAGILAASGQLEIAKLLILVPLCAIVGDQIGYWIGRKAGQALYRRDDSLIFRKRHLERAHEFYERYGGKTVVLARFIPIVRTFCPPVAGAAEMSYGRYLAYDVAGGLLWVGSMILCGYFLGRQIPNINQNIHYVIGVVIFLSLLPAIISVLRARFSGSSRPPSVQTPVRDSGGLQVQPTRPERH
jgi:membrane-associated protein